MMRAIQRFVVTASAACLFACGSHPTTSPSAPSPVPTPTPAPAPAPTPTPSPAPPPGRSVNISGIVHDGFDRSPLAQVSVIVSNNLSNTAIATTDSAGRFSATAAVPPGLSRIEFRRSGFFEQVTLLPGIAPPFDVLQPRSCTVPAVGVDGNGINHNLQLTSKPDVLYFYWAPSNQPVRDYWISIHLI
jgi:hypothetical protein